MVSKTIAAPEGIDGVVEVSSHYRRGSLSPLEGCREDRRRVEAIAKLGHALVDIIMSVEMRIPEQVTGKVLTPVDITQMQGEPLDQCEVRPAESACNL
jgi:hypothetical protein